MPSDTAVHMGGPHRVGPQAFPAQPKESKLKVNLEVDWGRVQGKDNK